MTTKIFKELREHVPFTFFAIATAIIVVVLFQYYFEIEFSEEIFHFFHFSHIVASAMVTGALYYKYRKLFLKAFLIGISGAIIIGSLSDILFPYLGGKLLGLEMHFHLPLIEETFSTLFFALIGSLMGILTQITKFPHFVHVFLSVFASLFYILAFSFSFSLIYLFGAFFIVFIAVIVPCCISDIVFPLIFIKKRDN